ncbi:G-type lectin S-receptor-like serine/threonine-protein kinase B120 isoform X2 [Triticum urartu]|uniref:G-type lectin S-receptor-like serine/threonine-protein kinase B120 isoform X2 n=1 Tax=Triticum urartu TaxID=4572 RepID=UPI0020445F08|nr:G-type lectin S-receptor-like serine/threonine-protein kinase B120 isoform X2 [Triticum urartu]XP_048559342.1 G-type lectin S-receptor-like serine/threonine-protein kinase B120 isoform X2 [Triticum urartu]
MGMHYISIFFLLFLSSLCKSDDQLTQAKPLTHDDKLVSKSGDFALGFFSLTTSNKSFYLGIWYHSLPGPHTVVWVANRDNPIVAPLSAKLIVTNNSQMVLFDSRGHNIWMTPSNITAGAPGAYAELSNSGNFVLRLPSNTDIWQSFDHPTDTILAGMRFLVSHKAQVITRLVAWKGSDDPSSGDLSISGDPSAPDLQLVTWNKTRPYCRTVWNGVSVSGGTYLSNTSSILYQTVVNSGDEFYFTYAISDNSVYTRVMLDHTGKYKFLAWNNHSSSWALISEYPTAACELYASCGPFSYCDLTQMVPTCQCLEGFETVDDANFSNGCRRKQALKCGNQSHFVALPGMKVRDKVLHIHNRSLDECEAECRRNCSCVAYAYANLSGAIGMADPSRCLVWSGELVDIWKATTGGESLYLRLADSPGTLQKKEKQKKLSRGYFSTSNNLEGKHTEFPFVSYGDILSATNFFADSNLLGRGGFGNVYKGTLEGGNEVAVKRLSQSSGQGIVEFKNEVILIAKLQHKNLVGLLGSCIHEDEKLLIYEYLPNKSLDVFLFNASRKHVLDWSTRLKIIKGIARGLLYLHQDSRLTIIHRDLKASNILLDTEMNPKISDFGMARIFATNQNQANTTRVVGTYGYMSPEYAMGGAFSVKSDTYSFGVLLLEIVSGLKINSPQLITNFSSLITYAWRLWEDGNAIELVDSSFVASFRLHEVLRCIHVGLLCVQDHARDRPLMSSVMFMFENESAPLPAPKQPVYFAQGTCADEEGREITSNSVNAVSITTVDGR